MIQHKDYDVGRSSNDAEVVLQVWGAASHPQFSCAPHFEVHHRVEAHARHCSSPSKASCIERSSHLEDLLSWQATFAGLSEVFVCADACPSTTFFWSAALDQQHIPGTGNVSYKGAAERMQIISFHGQAGQGSGPAELSEEEKQKQVFCQQSAFGDCLTI